MSFKVASFTIFALLSYSLRAFAGAGSSGGEPNPPLPPSVPFSYDCQVELAQQKTFSGKTCYADAFKNFKLYSSHMKSGDMLGGRIYLETDNKDWNRGHAWNGCPSLPTYLSGHMIELHFGRDKKDNSTTNLYVRVQKKSESEILFAESDTTKRFTDKVISAKAAFSHSNLKGRTIVKDLTLSLSVHCRRTR